jgi:hypothetical protein
MKRRRIAALACGVAMAGAATAAAAAGNDTAPVANNSTSAANETLSLESVSSCAPPGYSAATRFQTTYVCLNLGGSMTTFTPLTDYFSAFRVIGSESAPLR